MSDPLATAQAMDGRSAARAARWVLEGELGVRELEELTRELARRARRGPARWLLDFSEVPHLDYRGVRPLLGELEALRRLGCEVRLEGLSPYLAAVFRAAGGHDALAET